VVEPPIGGSSTGSTFNRGWIVVSMKNDWRRVFPWESTGK
jgi:hypothetical protein